uniref:SARAF-like protein n=1 Tax=Metapenaeus joyneri majanivirus TaxID=2984280 RepID=A0A9C7EYV2_9VIRU|nr:MAG: SARAF-like protein [Metapenaeus joyneri majanivirus]
MKSTNWLTMPASLLVLILLGLIPGDSALKNDDGIDSILLKDIEVLTLSAGKMTNGKRSTPIPQLECIKSGTAPCDAFKPRVVQCLNRGWDGVNVQWECKADMDNELRFGQLEVSCEGYRYRDDPSYVLKGSCGLRYSLDYTKERYHHQKKEKYERKDNNYYYYYFKEILFVIGENSHSSTTTSEDNPGGGAGAGTGAGGGCNRNRSETNNTNGFWNNFWDGVLLGYIFGDRRDYYPTTRGCRSDDLVWRNLHWNSWRDFGGGGSGYREERVSSGTRIASGFGGTSKR